MIFNAMMKKIKLSALLLCCSVLVLSAAKQPVAGKMEGQRRYSVIVNQVNDTVTMNRAIRSMRGNSAKLGNRTILQDMAGGYVSLGTSGILSASQSIIGLGVGYLKESMRDKRPDWEKATLGECRFIKVLPMQTEILDFYGTPSSVGALDPTNMKFSGFGCRQCIVIVDSAGHESEEEVFYLSCRVRTDEHGIARMLNHSKFEVEVDELRFNPYLCNLPNDSISRNPDTRIGFSFDKRKDLKFNVVATIKSSWINEAIQVANDVTLGKFIIQADIDPKFIGDDNVFRYNSKEDAGGKKHVTVTGDSFLVPRSYVGSSDMLTASDSWGTGQYKVEMMISETCRINENYYTKNEDGEKKWNKEKWEPEWKMMKKRGRQSPFWSQFADQVFPSFTGDKWVTTIVEPFTTVVIKHEGQLLNAAAAGMPTGGTSATASAAKKQTPSAQPAQGQIPKGK